MTATDDHTVVMKTERAQPEHAGGWRCPSCPSTSGRTSTARRSQTFANDTDAGRQRTVLAGRGADRRSSYRFTANKQYWAGAPKIDEVVLRVFANDEAMAQALMQGRDRLGPRPARDAFDALSRTSRASPRSRRSTRGFNELGLQPRRGDGRRQGDRRRPPGAAGQAGAASRSTTRSTARRWWTRCCAATARSPPASSRRCTRTCTTSRAASERARSTWPRPTRSSTRPATPRAPTASAPCRTANASSSSACSAAQRSRDSQEQAVQYITRLARGRSGIGVDRLDHGRGQPHPVHRRGRRTTCSSGAGWSSRTRTSSCPCSPAASGPRRTATRSPPGWSDSFYCNPAFDALYDKQKTMIDPAAAGRHGQAGAAAALRRRAVRR